MKHSILLCSACFGDEGLKINAFKLGIDLQTKCPNCKSLDGKKLTREALETLSFLFFVRGSILKTPYGAAPLIQFNQHHEPSMTLPGKVGRDMRLIEHTLGIGFFPYGPRLWMIGEVEPLKELQSPRRRQKIIRRIFQSYPVKALNSNDVFYRLRKNPAKPSDKSEYDSPPLPGTGRLDSRKFPVLYGSQDIELCVHECRAMVEDELFVATIKPRSRLKLLDLTHLLFEEGVTEFDSLDMAIHMLFYAAKHSYKISRTIARNAKAAGFDGIIYPSFFSALKTGSFQFATVYGISTRMISELSPRVRKEVIPNIALFGRPIADEVVKVTCINRVYMTQAAYDLNFGPVMR
jgi:hypothetical protein